MMRRWQPLWSATARLVVLIFVLQIIVIGGVLVYARYAIVQGTERDHRALVTEVQEDLRGWWDRGGDAALAAEIDKRLTTLRGENLVLLLETADGKIAAGNLGGWPPVVSTRPSWQRPR